MRFTLSLLLSGLCIHHSLYSMENNNHNEKENSNQPCLNQFHNNPNHNSKIGLDKNRIKRVLNDNKENKPNKKIQSIITEFTFGNFKAEAKDKVKTESKVKMQDLSNFGFTGNFTHNKSVRISDRTGMPVRSYNQHKKKTEMNVLPFVPKINTFFLKKENKKEEKK